MGEGKAPLPERRRLAAERTAARKAAASRRQNRQYWIVGGITIVLVVVAVLAGAAFLGGGDDDEDTDLPVATVDPNDPVAPVLVRFQSGECPQPAGSQEWRAVQASLSTPAAQASAEAQLAAWDQQCGLGQAMPDQGRGHIPEGEEHVPYNSNPPTSGPHYGYTAPWGVSREPIPPEVQVHNLEHGGVLLQYNCDCPDAIALLERFANPDTGYPTKVIAAPNPTMPTEIAFTAWGRIWTMSAAELSEARVSAFLEGYVDRGPEFIPSETEQLEAWREGN
jgi:hypothetical protein